MPQHAKAKPTPQELQKVIDKVFAITKIEIKRTAQETLTKISKLFAHPFVDYVVGQLCEEKKQYLLRKDENTLWIRDEEHDVWEKKICSSLSSDPIISLTCTIITVALLEKELSEFQIIILDKQFRTQQLSYLFTQPTKQMPKEMIAIINEYDSTELKMGH